MNPPTFYHTSVLLAESLAGLAIVPDGVYVDATFGGGGHSSAILDQLGPEGRLIAFDQDADAWRNAPKDQRLIPVTENFRYMRRFLRLHGHPKVDGILADLGVSSWQFDTAERGFSVRFDGPLDMRMDQRTSATAAQILRQKSEQDLHSLFENYGEIRNSRELARHIVQHRNSSPLESIAQLKAMVNPIVKGNPNRYFAQLFQALRIAVNEEMEVLKEFLEQSPECLKPGGRLSVISFHSLEDRLVKNFMKRGRWNEEADEMGRITTDPLLKPITPKPIEPTEEEQKINPRSRSARLRVAQRIES